MLVTFVDDHRFRAMGTDCHLQVVEGAGDACDLGEAIVRADERRWSRFLADSELSAINDRAGSPVAVSAETSALVGLALDAQRRTRGWFDPRLGEQVRAAGYDRSFDALSSGGPVPLGPSAPTSTATPTTVDEGVVAIPPGPVWISGGSPRATPPTACSPPSWPAVRPGPASTSVVIWPAPVRRPTAADGGAPSITDRDGPSA